MTRSITVNLTVFAGGFFCQRASQPALDRIEQKFTAFGAAGITLQMGEFDWQIYQWGPSGPVMSLTIDRGEKSQDLQVSSLFPGHNLWGAADITHIASISERTERSFDTGQIEQGLPTTGSPNRVTGVSVQTISL